MADQQQQQQLSPADRMAQQELQQFLQSESVKQRFQAQVHQFTDMCWDKCITKVGKKLDRSDESCLGYCVERYLDAGQLLVKRLEKFA